MKRILSASVLLAMFGALFVPAQSAMAMHEGICAGVLLADAAGAETYNFNGTTYEILNADEGETSGGSGNQAIIGTDGPDVLNGGSGDDILCGLGGDDELNGGSGNDFLIGDIGLINGAQPAPGANPANAGDDVLNGGGGNDVLYGDAGDDELFGGSGDDSFFGGPDNDFCDGGSGTNNFNPAVTAAVCETIED